MKHVTIIDSLRAFAAISVCLYHFICTTIGFNFPEYFTDIFNYGQYGVYIFFVISGFIIPWSMYHNNYHIKSFFKFIIKRLIRLEPPYLFSIILILSIVLLKSKMKIGIEGTEQITFTQIGLHFGYLINFFHEYKWLNNVYWTLAIEFQYYIIISFLYVLFISSNIFYRISGYLIIYIMAFLLLNDPTNSHFPVYGPLFLIGISTFQLKTKIITILEYILISIPGIIFSYVYIDPNAALFAIFTSLIIIFFSEQKLPILNSLGKYSYSLYLLHPIIGAAIINILSRYVNTYSQKIGIIILGLSITIVCSYFMYLFIENPAKKLSSKIKL